MALHNFKIEPLDETRARVYIDDKKVLASGYTITHEVGEVPRIELNLYCMPEYEGRANVRVVNKEELAMLLDKNEFNEFCKIWMKMNSHIEE